MTTIETLVPREKSTHYGIPVYKVALVRESMLSQLQRPHIDNAAAAARVLAAYLVDEDREHLVVLLLNTKKRVIGINTVSVGSLSASLGHPREIFKSAILANAAALILGHNHPSGEVTPSAEDVELTKRLTAVGDLLGIRLLDHLIIGEQGRWFLFQDDGGLSHLTPWRASL
jgi:DNA repair protein RadC